MKGDIISTKLFSLQPVGLNTELVESQTSYISRLAEAHSVSVGSLIGKVIAPVLKKRYLLESSENGGSRFYDFGFELNGIGKQAKDFSQVLFELTGVSIIRNLTLTSLYDVIPIREMFRHSKAWCPMCLEDWKNSEQIIYEPLIWNFKAVNMCGIHKVRLKIQCPNCSMKIPVLSRKSRNGFCSFCGFWLGSNDEEKADKISLDQFSWESFIVSNIGSLVKHGEELSHNISGNRIDTFIKIVIEAAGGIGAFSRYFDIPRSTVKPWYEVKHRPVLFTLLKICYIAGINITEVFSSNNLQIWLAPRSNELYTCTENTHDNNPFRKRKIDWYSVEIKLKDVIKNKAIAAPSVREVARSLGYDKRLLYSHFPALCKAISENHAVFTQMMKQKRIEEGCKKVSEATVKLYNSGVYPSRRSIEKFLSSNLILREKAYQTAWKKTLVELDLI